MADIAICPDLLIQPHFNPRTNIKAGPVFGGAGFCDIVGYDKEFPRSPSLQLKIGSAARK
jgi:hypothetical protein